MRGIVRRQVINLVLLVALAGMGSVTSFGGSAPAAGFTCPFAKAADAPKGAPPLNEFFSGATDVTADKRLGDIMYELRRSGMTSALIVDHLVSSYCPLVEADKGLSDAQKTEVVRRFARHVAGLAFFSPGSDALEVYVDVPLLRSCWTRSTTLRKRPVYRETTGSLRPSVGNWPRHERWPEESLAPAAMQQDVMLRI